MEDSEERLLILEEQTLSEVFFLFFFPLLKLLRTVNPL
jgi:hypothetical protein